MNNTETIQILGKDYSKECIKYAYTGKKMKYKKYIKYLGIFFLLVCLMQSYVTQQFISHFSSSRLPTTPYKEMGENLTSVLGITVVIEISLIVAFIIVLIPRINCLFLKIDGIKKDIILYKSIHTDEVALLANEINLKIKENNFSTFP